MNCPYCGYSIQTQCVAFYCPLCDHLIDPDDYDTAVTE